jgi:hypothetical protein
MVIRGQRRRQAGARPQHAVAARTQSERFSVRRAGLTLLLVSAVFWMAIVGALHTIGH